MPGAPTSDSVPVVRPAASDSELEEEGEIVSQLVVLRAMMRWMQYSARAAAMDGC